MRETGDQPGRTGAQRAAQRDREERKADQRRVALWGSGVSYVNSEWNLGLHPASPSQASVSLSALCGRL